MKLQKWACILLLMCMIVLLSSCGAGETPALSDRQIEETREPDPTENSGQTAQFKEEGDDSMPGEHNDTTSPKIPYALHSLDSSMVNSFAFFVGRVTQSFERKDATRSIEGVLFDEYIDRESKTIQSQTGELFWDYGEGVLQFDTACAQGALGFFANKAVELTNLTIHSENEYVTVACVSLDGKALSESGKILLQIMTEDRYTGYTAQDGVIKALGSLPIMVRDIKVTVKMKNVSSKYVSWLDENGYVLQTNSVGEDTFDIKPSKDVMYILLTTEEPQSEPGLYQLKTTEEDYWSFRPAADEFKNSPIDLRFLNEDVAGEKGFVSKSEDGFLLGDGAPVNLWAVNTALDIIKMPKEQVDVLAKRLAKLGVNMVRMHGRVYEWDWGYVLTDLSDLSKVNAEFLDQYHYFISAMKREGIYTALSFYFPLWVEMEESFGFPGYNGNFAKANPFGLLFFNKEFQEIYQAWAKQLLLTVNPYTGLALADDPAVALIEIQNEDSMLF